MSNRGTTISDPILRCDLSGNVTKNEPACFRKNSPVTIRVDIAGSPSVPSGGLQVKVQCFGYHANTGLVMIPASSKTITVTNWGNEDYSALYWSSNNLPDNITRYPLKLSFEFWIYENGNWVWQNQHVLPSTRVYTTIATPISPMSTPWVEVIDYVSQWCGGMSSEADISDEIARDLYNAKWSYTGMNTHTSGTFSSQTLWLGEMMDSAWADCKDFGNFYTCAMRSVGLYGYAYLVQGTFTTKKILGAKSSTWYSFT